MSATLSVATTLSNKALREARTPGQSCERRLDHLARAGALLVAIVGIVVLCDWLLEMRWFGTVMPELRAMKVNTAWAFVAAGIALWLLRTRSLGSASYLAARILAVIVIALGGLTL